MKEVIYGISLILAGCVSLYTFFTKVETVEQQKAIILQLQKDIEQAEKKVAEYAEIENTLRVERNAWRQAAQEARLKNEEYAKWADTALPSCVIGKYSRLCEESTGVR